MRIGNLFGSDSKPERVNQRKIYRSIRFFIPSLCRFFQSLTHLFIFIIDICNVEIIYISQAPRHTGLHKASPGRTKDNTHVRAHECVCEDRSLKEGSRAFGGRIRTANSRLSLADLQTCSSARHCCNGIDDTNHEINLVHTELLWSPSLSRYRV